MSEKNESALAGCTITPAAKFNFGITLSISNEGVTYKGKLIEDAGECYAALIEFFKQNNVRLK